MQFRRCIVCCLVIWSVVRPALAADPEIVAVYSDAAGSVLFLTEIPDGVSLKSDDVLLMEDDKPTLKAAEVKSFRDSAWKLDLAFCIDTSGTMAGKPLAETRRALGMVLTPAFFNSQDRIALMAFQNKPRNIQWYGDYNESFKKIKHLKWKPGEKKQNTVLYDALFNALTRLQTTSEPQPPVLQRILVISDGKDEGSEKSLIEVKEKALDVGVAIDVVTRVRSDRVQEDLEMGYVQDLNALADKTGGKFRHAEPGQVPEAVKDILQRILAFKVVRFERKLKGDEPLTKRVAIQFKAPGKPIQAESPVQIARTPPPPPNNKTPVDPPWWARWEFWFFLALFICAIGVIKRLVTKPSAMDQPPEPQRQLTSPKPIALPDSSNEMHFEPEVNEVRTKTVIGGYYYPTPKPETPAALLVGIEGPAKGQQYAIDKPIYTIGAGSQNDLALADDDFVSADHAYLRHERGSLFLFDKNSLNGTFVNDHQLTDVGVTLQLEDHIKIGTSVFRIAQAER